MGMVLFEEREMSKGNLALIYTVITGSGEEAHGVSRYLIPFPLRGSNGREFICFEKFPFIL